MQRAQARKPEQDRASTQPHQPLHFLARALPIREKWASVSVLID
jgi:hypothetical protein